MKISKLILFIISIILAISTLSCAQSSNTPLQTTQAELTDPPKASATVKIMTFNLYGYDQDTFKVAGTEDLAQGRVSVRGPKFLEMLEGEKIDIAGLQEGMNEWYHYLDSLPEKYAYFNEGGFAILYNQEKFELLESDHYYLAKGTPKEEKIGWDADWPRVVISGVFKEKASGVIFLVCNTHFDHAGEVARRESAKIVCEKIPEQIEAIKSKYNVEEATGFLIGDYNTEPYEEPYNIIAKTMKDARKVTHGVTISDNASSSPGLYYISSTNKAKADGHFIDHIFFFGRADIEFVKMIHTSTNLCEYGEYISDHNAVIANVTIKN